MSSNLEQMNNYPKKLFKQKKLKVLNRSVARSELKLEVELVISGQASIYESDFENQSNKLHYFQSLTNK